MKTSINFLVAILTGATLLFGCTGADEAATQSPDTTVGAGNPETTTERTEIRSEALSYDPQAVQPENGPQLSETQVRKTVNIGLAAPGLQDFLRRNDYKVSEVMRTESMHYRPNTTDSAHPAGRVTIVLDDPVPLEESGYKGDVCSVGGATGPVTGMVWIVDLVEQRVAALSPQWNYDVSCT